jgi:hypothetical protein
MGAASLRQVLVDGPSGQGLRNDVGSRIHNTPIGKAVLDWLGDGVEVCHERQIDGDALCHFQEIIFAELG